MISKGENAWAELVVMYKTPKDTAAFGKHYFETHAPLARLPGLRKYQVSRGADMILYDTREV